MLTPHPTGIDRAIASDAPQSDRMVAAWIHQHRGRLINFAMRLTGDVDIATVRNRRFMR